MLLKLVSNGKNTRIELDGKDLGDVKAINFYHRKESEKDNNCRLNVEFDLTALTYDEAAKKRAFVNVWPPFNDVMKAMDDAFGPKEAQVDQEDNAEAVEAEA